MKLNDSDKGFTLIEVLVAVFVFSIIMMTLFSSFKAFMSTSRFITQAVSEEEVSRIALGRIQKDLQMIFMVRSPRYKPPGIGDDPDPFRFYATRESIGGEHFSRIEFASLARVKTVDTPQAGVGGVIYYVRENRIDGFDLCRFESVPGSQEEPDPCRDPIIAKNIKKFDLIFFNKDEDENEEWDSDHKAFDYVFPSLIRIKLDYAGESNRQIETAFYLPVNRKDS